MKKTAIVTGSTGFIGSWLTKELLENDYEVTLLVRKADRLPYNLASQCKVIECGDRIFDSRSLDGKYDVFFHLAWDGVSSERKNDFNIQMNNILLAIEAMKAAKKMNVDKFVISGTVAEYVFCENIMDLNAKQTPNDFYGAAKVSVHYFLDVLSRQIEQPYIYAVLPSTYGEGRKDDNILTYTIKTLMKREKPLYGNLEQLWDFLYVSDVVKALRLLGEKGIEGKTYGIGSGIFLQLKDYIIKVRDIIDPELELGIGERPDLSVKSFSSCVNTYDLVKDVGFRPSVTFDNGIRRMIRYFESYNESSEKN